MLKNRLAKEPPGILTIAPHKKNPDLVPDGCLQVPTSFTLQRCTVWVAHNLAEDVQPGPPCGLCACVIHRCGLDHKRMVPRRLPGAGVKVPRDTSGRVAELLPLPRVRCHHAAYHIRRFMLVHHTGGREGDTRKPRRGQSRVWHSKSISASPSRNVLTTGGPP